MSFSAASLGASALIGVAAALSVARTVTLSHGFTTTLVVFGIALGLVVYLAVGWSAMRIDGLLGGYIEGRIGRAIIGFAAVVAVLLAPVVVWLIGVPIMRLLVAHAGV